MRGMMDTRMAASSTYISRLADAYRRRAAELYPDAEGVECLETMALIDDWLALRAAVSALAAGGDVTSYSIAGRSVSRADLGALRGELAAVESDLYARLRMPRSVAISDMREAVR